MTITRANAEALLIKRCGDLLTVASLDGTTVAGANADLNDPIGFALRQVGLTVTTPTAVADADLAGLPDADLDEFLDLAELRTLETVHSHLLDLVDTAAGQRHDEYSQLANGLALKIDRLGLRLRQVYGWTAATVESGHFTAGFAEHFET